MVRTSMPSSTGRHALRKNLREARHHGDEDIDSDGEHHIDDFNDNNGDTPATTSENGQSVGDLRASFQNINSFDFDETKETKTIKRKLSSSLDNDLADSKSELARFLMANKKDEDDVGLFRDITKRANAAFDNTVFKSMRNIATGFITGEDEEVKSMRTNKAWFYSLALEPMDVRRDRIIMLAEAYAIFGALFLSGTWVLYEWGSSLGYGGCRYDSAEFCNANIDRAFEAVMALSMTANIFQAMFASFLWLMSILFSGSHRNWVYGARNLLVLCHLLLVSVFILTISGCGLGLWAKFAPHWPELAVCLAFLVTIIVYGIVSCSFLFAENCPLEFYHLPLWFKWGIFPYPMLRRGGRQKIRELAETRAMELKARAYKEKSISDTRKSMSKKKSQVPMTSAGAVVRRAANSIGRRNFDVSKYEQRLEADWFTESEELRELSVDVLAKYMPRRLAIEVHKQLQLDKADHDNTVRSSHTLGTGRMGEGSDHRVSWDPLGGDADDSD